MSSFLGFGKGWGNLGGTAEEWWPGPRDLGEGRAAFRGLWTKGSVGLGRRQLVSTPRAYQLPPSLLEAAQRALRLLLGAGLQIVGAQGAEGLGRNLPPRHAVGAAAAEAAAAGIRAAAAAVLLLSRFNRVQLCATP